jgi:hypothetical protein
MPLRPPFSSRPVVLSANGPCNQVKRETQKKTPMSKLITFVKSQLERDHHRWYSWKIRHHRRSWEWRERDTREGPDRTVEADVGGRRGERGDPIAGVEAFEKINHNHSKRPTSFLTSSKTHPAETFSELQRRNQSNINRDSPNSFITRSRIVPSILGPFESSVGNDTFSQIQNAISIT